MAKLFGVSAEALIIRLKTVGLLGDYVDMTLDDLFEMSPETRIA